MLIRRNNGTGKIGARRKLLSVVSCINGYNNCRSMYWKSRNLHPPSIGLKEFCETELTKRGKARDGIVYLGERPGQSILQVEMMDSKKDSKVRR